MCSYTIEFKPTSGRVSKMFPVAVVVSKKIVKKAVDRNKIKRRLRHLAQKLNLTGIFYVKKDISKMLYKDLRQELEKYIK